MTTTTTTTTTKKLKFSRELLNPKIHPIAAALVFVSALVGVVDVVGLVRPASAPARVTYAPGVGYGRGPQTWASADDAGARPITNFDRMNAANWANILSGGPRPAVGLYWYDNADPTVGPGMSAPADQLLIRTDSPSIYYKSGTANTAWTLIGSASGGGGGITGSGTANTLAMFTGATSVGDSPLIYDGSAVVTVTNKNFAVNTNGQAVLISTFQAASTDGFNICIGGGCTHSAFSSLATDGSRDVSVGVDALLVNTRGYDNTAIGTAAMRANTTGNGNTAIGRDAMFSNTTGADNTAIGNNAMYYNVSSSNDVAIGFSAIGGATGGANNIGIGVAAGYNTTTGHDNVSIGTNAGQLNSTGVDNVAIGTDALQNSTATGNIGIGVLALQSSTGIANIAIGVTTLQATTSGTQNVAVGNSSLESNTTGRNNVAIGVGILEAATDATDNIAIGVTSMLFVTHGSANVGVGGDSLYELTTGDNNVAIGSESGRGITTGRANTILGANVTGLAAGLSNNIIIADGDGNQRIKSDANGLISVGSNKFTVAASSGHVQTAGSTPTLGVGCGTGASISGTDLAGILTTGAAPTNCVVNFATAYATTPACIIQNTQGADNIGSYTVSASGFIYTPGLAGTGNPVPFICIGQP